MDGSLGMAYGVTSTTLLLAIGTNPAAASATVHLAEIGTTPASGLAHWKLGNVDWKVVAKIGVPGALGAFAGATFLAYLSTEVAAPVTSLILLTLGAYILIRFTLRGIDRRHLASRCASASSARGARRRLRRRHRWRRLGPVGTPAILASGRMEPRGVIGRSTPRVPGSRPPRASASCSP